MTNNNKLKIDNLVLEVTRNCNLQCNHCLRGYSNTQNLKNSVIDAIANKIDSINTVTFTGGEPFLNITGIEYFLNVCKAKDLSLEGFFIATNGTVLNDKILHVLMDLYLYCDPYDDCLCSVKISNTLYHEKSIYEENLEDIRKENENKLQLLKFIYLENRLSDKMFYSSLIKEGRWENSSNGRNQNNYNDNIEIEKYDNEYNIRENPIYIDVNGNVSLGCDYSYKSQKERVLFNILELSKEEIINKFIDVESLVNV